LRPWMVRRRPTLMSATCAALLILFAQTAAYSQPTGGVETFPLEYFAAAQPADAYDMVRRLPGFELIDVDEEVRGFTGSRGNVLFDGRPPTGKQESLEQMLRRIPASRVLRIELIRGGTAGAATGGYDLVANVVRKSGGSTSASALGGASSAKRIGVKPDLRLELSRESDGRRFDGSLAMETEVDDDSGSGEIIERDADGLLIGQADRDEREVVRTLSADAEYKTSLGAGELVGTLNASRERTKERIRTEEEDLSVADER